MKREDEVINEIQNYLDGNMESIHDVGCGVGLLLRAAQARGIEATGNELNGNCMQGYETEIWAKCFQRCFW